MELSMDLESDCVGFEQVQGLGSAATNPWPCHLDRDLVCTTNHGFDILAHGSQTHTETWETFAGTCKRHARPSWDYSGQTAGMWTLDLQPLRVKAYKANGYGTLFCHAWVFSLRLSSGRSRYQQP
jgi:hypothetical protein